jgi:glutamate racemase
LAHDAIGIFDSGVGGLTVFRAIAERLPYESLLYLGDTARLPYGTKSSQTVRAYACQAADRLVAEGIKLLVVACNTASATALPVLRERFAPLPVIGVVEPGAEAACAATRGGRIAVTGTDGTIAGGAYERAIRARRPKAELLGIPCGLFVALAEEGWTEGEVVDGAIRRYLGSALAEDPPDTWVLGCTHFPVLRRSIRGVVGKGPAIVDSAVPTAGAVARLLAELDLAAPEGEGSPQHRFWATDAPDRFARVGRVFLGRDLAPQGVTLVDL